MKIDLDAARAARREALGESPVLLFKGKEYELPPELPLDLIEVVVEIAGVLDSTTDESEASSLKVFGIFKDMFQMLLGDQYEAFKSSGPSIGDIGPLLLGIREVYGVSLGKSQPSGRPSNRAGRRSRQTSKPTTRSTSVKSIGAMG